MAQSLPVAVHPELSVYPLMNRAEFNGLKVSIREHGVFEPVVFVRGDTDRFDDGVLVDGRCRILACIELGIDWRNHARFLPDGHNGNGFAYSANACRRGCSARDIKETLDRMDEYSEGRTAE